MPFKDVATSDSVFLRTVPPSNDTAARTALRRLIEVSNPNTSSCDAFTSDEKGCKSNDGTCASHPDALLVTAGNNECEDRHEKCAVWASKGECAHNKQYMTEYCKLSCDRCEVDSGDEEYYDDDDDDDYDDDEEDSGDDEQEEDHNNNN